MAIVLIIIGCIVGLYIAYQIFTPATTRWHRAKTLERWAKEDRELALKRLHKLTRGGHIQHNDREWLEAHWQFSYVNDIVPAIPVHADVRRELYRRAPENIEDDDFDSRWRLERQRLRDLDRIPLL